MNLRAWQERAPEGPWLVEVVGEGHIYVGRGEANERLAKLFAAAPKMHAALVGVIRVADRATVEFDAARAAIAAAGGEV